MAKIRMSMASVTGITIAVHVLRDTSFLLCRHEGGKGGERMGSKRGTDTERSVVPTQREVLRDVMLAAGKYGAWMTLRKLGRLTRYGETSISAQLRHLRKANCGGYVLEKRVRKPEVVSGEEQFVMWEYRLRAQALKQRGICAGTTVTLRRRSVS
jgi:hypothetical protein